MTKAATSPAPKVRTRTPSSPAPRAVWKSAPVVFTANSTVDDAMAGILAAARAHWLGNAAAAHEGHTIESIHQMRVGLRRFRSGLAVFKKYIPEAQFKWLTTEAKWLLNALGPARNLDVFLTDVVQPLSKAKKNSAHVRVLRRAAQAARTDAQTKLRSAIESKRYAQFMEKLDAWLTAQSWRRTGHKKKNPTHVNAAHFAKKTLNKRLIKILAYGKVVHTLPITELHELRIEIKKARYGIDFFQTLLPPQRVTKLIAAFKALQKSFGHLNDLAMAEEIMEQLCQAAKTPAQGKALSKAGSVLVAHHRQAAADAIQGIAPRWRSLRKVGVF